MGPRRWLGNFVLLDTRALTDEDTGHAILQFHLLGPILGFGQGVSGISFIKAGQTS
jgi:hypothetical protein